jgi:hypothetical protein
MKFEIIDNCPVPAQLAPCIREIKKHTGATLNSCDRSKEAEPFLKRCKPPKMSQSELFDGFRHGRPGFNPANPPGFSTHERRNDGVAFPGPRGIPLRYWQVGMDWQNSEGVVEAAKRLGFTATRTYPNNLRETQHLNFRREPRVGLPALKSGSKGVRVARMAKMLATARDAAGKPYLDKPQSVYDEKLEQAVRRFQREWDQKEDGIYGSQTARQLAVAVRRTKKEGSK